ncbi:MAG: DNA polymerase I [Acidobacteria bacterium]|nr:DNA polymerase I [Acidobacteriota bacterium]
MESSPRLFLIDTYGLIFRAYYGRARAAVPSMRTTRGEPTEAVYVFATMLRRLLRDQRPDYVAAVWEGEGPTFRDDEFADYKAHREATPEELQQQIPLIRRLLEAQRTPVLACDGYEADDVIGTLARQAAEHDVDVFLISSDKDLMQLVDERVKLLNPMKNDQIFDADGVKEFMGVTPKQVIDLLALKGDSVDNIPGAPGIGDKGARQLIEEYGSVEEAIRRADEVQRKAYRESLQNNQDQILLSKRLATIAVDAPIELDLDALAVGEPDLDKVRALYTELEFHSLLSELDVPEEQKDTATTVVQTPEALAEWLAAQPAGPLAVAVSLHDAGDDAVIEAGGVALSAQAGDAAFAAAADLALVKPLLEDAARAKRVHDEKSTLKALRRRGVELRGVIDDTMLAGFLVDSSRTDYSLPKAVARKLGVQLDDDLGRAADLIRALGVALEPELEQGELQDVYRRIEMPLAPILAAMEETGVLVDAAVLHAQSDEMAKEIWTIEQDIHELAGGRDFNVNSTKQLADILFDELGLPAPPRRGKTKARSTAADVLEGLAPDYPIAGKILEYRELSKLKSTYVDALPNQIDPRDGRIHTTFNPTGSATGRLSSSDPNLQNIPIRTESGRRIRAAFIAPPGHKLLAADYSQIELRVLAHVSGDKTLQDAFRKGEDVHTRTAAEVFGVPPMMVGPEERRRAKAVNFGIVYGLSPFGLSQQLGIPQKEARDYINAYLELYSGVKKYMDSTVAQARREGYSKTMFGRRRPITDLGSRNPAARGFAERTAINSPIQGAAADLIKLAMIDVDRLLREKELGSRLLLQVHDELLLEVPDAEVEAVGPLLKRAMEQVHELAVPLVADLKVGLNWRDLKAL